MARAVFNEPAPRHFLEAAKAFAGTAARIAPSHADFLSVLLLSGQALERGLKASLIASGWNADQVKTMGHDLVAAWNAVVRAGVPLGTIPDWAVRLSQLHDAPYHVRFPAVDGYVTPPVQQLAGNVVEVVDKIEAALR